MAHMRLLARVKRVRLALSLSLSHLRLAADDDGAPTLTPRTFIVKRTFA